MASSFPSSGAPTRPVLSRKHFPQARNTVDHLRGDRKDELKRVASLSKMGRFHAETPRGFASSKAPQSRMSCAANSASRSASMRTTPALQT